MRGRRAVELELTQAERTELQALAARRSTAQGLALRARIILACADGSMNHEIAARLDCIVPECSGASSALTRQGG